jgi:hypothetical protein
MTHTLEPAELICNIDPMVLVAILLNPEIRISQPILDYLDPFLRL